MTKKALLKWQIEMGADEAIGETPRNYFAAPPLAHATIVPSAPTHATLGASAILQASPTRGATAARSLADQAETLAALESAIRAFEGCALKKTATKTVIGDGNPEAPLMIIGEAPGADEDRQGIPFCGVSGQLLDRMLAAAGYDRSRCYISNSVYWRPPGNRQPSIEETTICLPFVEKMIALVRPKILLLAGGTATGALLGKTESMTRLRGRLYEYHNRYLDAPISCMVTYHPSYLLRQPAQKRLTWQDMLLVKQRLED